MKTVKEIKKKLEELKVQPTVEFFDQNQLRHAKIELLEWVLGEDNGN